jgi:hypothetical protein
MLRPLLRFAMALLGGLCLLLATTLLIVSGYRGWQGHSLCDAGMAFVVALLCSAVTWYYDVILLKLTPEGYQLALWS